MTDDDGKETVMVNSDESELELELQNFIIRAAREDVRPEWTQLFNRAVAAMGWTDQQVMANLACSLPNLRRWRNGLVVPPAFVGVMGWLLQDLKEKRLGTFRCQGERDRDAS